MSWMRVSKLPVMVALRDVTAGRPLRLFGSKPTPQSLRQAGRRGGSTKKAKAFVQRLSRTPGERGMSAVTLGDQAKALAMLDGRSSQRDLLLLSLSRQLTWTEAQRKLIEQMWSEQARKPSEP